MTRAEIKKILLDGPEYWIEGVNGMLYHHIVSFMESNSMNKKQMAEYLGISAGRLSQILNDESNFRLESLVNLALKLNLYPDFKLVDKSVFLDDLDDTSKSFSISFANLSPEENAVKVYPSLEVA